MILAVMLQEVSCGEVIDKQGRGLMSAAKVSASKRQKVSFCVLFLSFTDCLL